MRILFAGIMFTLLIEATAYGQPADKKPAHYVGEVIITGNTITRDRVIRAVVNMHPGQILNYPDLRIAEQNLARLGIFKFDPAKKIGPKVTVPNNPGIFKDILIQVEEEGEQLKSR